MVQYHLNQLTNKTESNEFVSVILMWNVAQHTTDHTKSTQRKIEKTQVFFLPVDCVLCVNRLEYIYRTIFSDKDPYNCVIFP